MCVNRGRGAPISEDPSATSGQAEDRRQRTEDSRVSILRSSPAKEDGRLMGSAFVKAMAVEKLRRDKPAQRRGKENSEEGHAIRIDY
jgi:hypothetical protein